MNVCVKAESPKQKGRQVSGTVPFPAEIVLVALFCPGLRIPDLAIQDVKLSILEIGDMCRVCMYPLFSPYVRLFAETYSACTPSLVLSL